MKRYIRGIACIIGLVLLALACSTENVILIDTLGIAGISLLIPLTIHLARTEEQRENGDE